MFIVRFAIFSKKNNISGSTGSKKSLETGKYFLNQGSSCCEYFTDTSILVLFLLLSMFCLHACRQLCFSSRSTNCVVPWFEQVPEIFIYLRFYWVKEIAWNGKILYNLRLRFTEHVTDASSILALCFYHIQGTRADKTTTLYFWLARDLKLQPIKSHNFSGRPLSLVSRARETGKLKKTCPFVTPMKKFHRLKPTTPVTLCWNTSLNVTIYLPESVALPPLNVEWTNFGHLASHYYQHWGAGSESFPTNVSEVVFGRCL